MDVANSFLGRFVLKLLPLHRRDQLLLALLEVLVEAFLFLFQPLIAMLRQRLLLYDACLREVALVGHQLLVLLLGHARVRGRRTEFALRDLPVLSDDAHPGNRHNRDLRGQLVRLHVVGESCRACDGLGAGVLQWLRQGLRRLRAAVDVQRLPEGHDGTVQHGYVGREHT